jgi:RTA1 like protein
MQSSLILIAPAFLVASIYMELGRIITMLHAEKTSVVPTRWLTRTFVMGDVLSFLMQASGMLILNSSRISFHCFLLIWTIGAGLMVSNSTNPSGGEHIIIGGLFVQIIFFGFFMITAAIFRLRIDQKPTGPSIELSSIWHKHLFALYATSILILIRSVVRVVEYIEGYEGFLMTYEVFVYVFDAFLMLVVMLIIHVIHPSQVNCLIGRGEIFFQKGFQVQKTGFTSTLELRNSA